MTMIIDPYRFGSVDDPPPPPPTEHWEIVFESGSLAGLRGYHILTGVGRLISANTDEFVGVYSYTNQLLVEMISDSQIPEDPPFTEVQIFEGPDFSGEPRVFLAEDIVSSSLGLTLDYKWVRRWGWSTPGEHFFEDRDGDVLSCRLIRP